MILMSLVWHLDLWWWSVPFVYGACGPTVLQALLQWHCKSMPSIDACVFSIFLYWFHCGIHCGAVRQVHQAITWYNFHVDHVVLDQLTCTRAMGSFSGRVGTKRETWRDTNGFFWRRGLNILGKQTSKRKRNIKEPHVKSLFYFSMTL